MSTLVETLKNKDQPPQPKPAPPQPQSQSVTPPPASTAAATKADDLEKRLDAFLAKPDRTDDNLAEIRRMAAAAKEAASEAERLLREHRDERERASRDQLAQR